MTGNSSYKAKWTYTPSNAMTYAPVFDMVAKGQCVSIPLPGHLHSLQSLEQALRCALVWLQEHGSHTGLQCSMRYHGKAIVVKPLLSMYGHTGYGNPYVIHDAQGRQLWQHSPPLEEGGSPGSKRKRMTSSHKQNNAGKIRPAARSRKSAGALDHSGFEADGSGI